MWPNVGTAKSSSEAITSSLDNNGVGHNLFVSTKFHQNRFSR